MSPGSSRADRLRRALSERVLILDGATGTYLQELDLSADDFGGSDLEGCNENLVRTRPDLVRRMHEDYLRAGADIVETNTFGATPIVLAEYDLADRCAEINMAAARLAREAAEIVEREDGRPRFVAGSMGPTTKSLSVTGGATFDQLRDSYRAQAAGLIEGGADFLLLETCQDTLNVKAALLGIEEANHAAGLHVPVAISCTIEPTGTMLGGQDVEAFWTSIEQAEPLFVGLNCSTGPDFMTDHVRSLSELATCFTSCYPNAGLPDEDGCYHESPEHVADKLRSFAERGWLNVVGGCCGTTPRHVTLLAERLAGVAPRVPHGLRGTVVSGLEAVRFLPENRPLLVGERTNVIGSRAFKRLVASGDWDAAAEVGRQQVRGGAQVIDVCLADTDRDERADILELLSRLVRKVKAPIMIDSTDADVLEAALRLTQGKCIVNSINLENGLERFEEVTPLLRRFGAAVVVGCIDDDPQQGMAVTRERKLAVALRSHELLTHRYGLAARDLIFDPLVFPCATGDVNYVGSALETIEGVRLIKEALPECKTILGISNVSFGLPEAAREIVNSVFLYLCTKAGLDAAIVNSEKLQRYASIPEKERLMAEELLMTGSEASVAAIAAHFRDRLSQRSISPLEGLPLDERIARHVVEGIQQGLVLALEEARTTRGPLDIVNGPLMAGMDEVGRLFNENKLIVAEVLQSAEVMKLAVTHLEQFMERSDAQRRGKVVLATVKGDVHDIGKNLVEIIFSNNGYQVVNLGIKVLPETLVRAALEHQPDAIGLSGLLVKSAREMVTTAKDFRDAGLTVPVLVGGAALSRRFTLTRIAPEHLGPVLYCSDATSGLDLMNKLMDPAARETLLAALARDVEAAREAADAAAAAAAASAAPMPSPESDASIRSLVARDIAIPSPPDLRAHVEGPLPFDDVRSWLNLHVLLGKHLGLRGSIPRLLEQGDAKALDLRDRTMAVAARAGDSLSVGATWRFFPVIARGNAVLVMDRPGGAEIARFDFPRQPSGERLCLSDFVVSEDPTRPDYAALFVTTCGVGLREKVRGFMDAGDYFEAHALQSLAIEGAEAAAEWLHARLRKAWGLADPPDLALADVFKARYHGLRVSFGYPACPRLEDQATLFRLLDPAAIGVSLTDGFMMDPEASVSAMVFHHPEARYFSV